MSSNQKGLAALPVLLAVMVLLSVAAYWVNLKIDDFFADRNAVAIQASNIQRFIPNKTP